MALTTEQRASLWEPDGSPYRGHRIVSARPGTGKTKTVTEYCIDIASTWTSCYASWQGMAVVSYTNVAKDEIEAKIRALGKANCLLSSPHFLGTVDAFLNQFVFLPFGSSFMKYDGGRPKLVGDPYRRWGSVDLSRGGPQAGAFSPLFFDCYSVGADGVKVTGVKPLKRNGHGNKVHPVSDKNSAKILAMKQRIWAAGYALQSDANFMAYSTLIESASLTQSFIDRFPVLIIDEAQDMTKVQHALLDHLKRSGQKHILLVGDEYQAIYEWNTARPQLFVDKVQDVDWSPKAISETFRCGGPICHVLSEMAADGRPVKPSSEGQNVAYVDPVQVVAYEKGSEQDDVRMAIDDLAKRLSGKRAHDGNKEDVKTLAVLCRSAQNVAALQALFTGKATRPGTLIEWGCGATKDYLRVLNALLKRNSYEAAVAYESLIYNSAKFASKADMRKELGQLWSASGGRDYRNVLFEDLEKIAASLPSGISDLTVSDSGVCCDVFLAGVQSTVLREIKADCASFKHPAKKDQDALLSSVFMGRGERVTLEHPDAAGVRLVFSTVHGVKGETYDGVLFYTKEKTSPCGCRVGSTPMWSRILKHPLADCELKRIAYVALSRAAQLLYIVTPAGSVSAWQSLAEAAVAL